MIISYGSRKRLNPLAAHISRAIIPITFHLFLSKRSRDFIQVKFNTNILSSFFVPFFLSSSKPSTFTSFVSLVSFFFFFLISYSLQEERIFPQAPPHAIERNSESKNKFPRILNVFYSPSFYLHRHFLFMYSSVC